MPGFLDTVYICCMVHGSKYLYESTFAVQYISPLHRDGLSALASAVTSKIELGRWKTHYPLSGRSGENVNKHQRTQVAHCAAYRCVIFCTLVRLTLSLLRTDVSLCVSSLESFQKAKSTCVWNGFWLPTTESCWTSTTDCRRKTTRWRERR